MERYILLDNNEKPSLRMRVHLLFCKKCRNEVFALASHFEKMKALEPVYSQPDMTDQVMKIIRHSRSVHMKKVTAFQWMSAEGIILASLVLVQFSPAKIWLDAALGDMFHLIISVTLAVIITIFSAILVMTHMNELNELKESFLSMIRSQ